MLDPKNWNANNLTPTADHPLLFVFRGQIPSLKNQRSIGVTKTGQVFNRPKPAVIQAIASIRDALDRQLPAEWTPFPISQEIRMWAILGAHGVGAIPDSDTDNLIQTLQEALAAPRQKNKMTEARRQRLIMQDDRQVMSLHAIRRTFADKDRIYHELYIWSGRATGEPGSDIAEYAKVAQVRKEELWK